MTAPLNNAYLNATATAMNFSGTCSDTDLVGAAIGSVQIFIDGATAPVTSVACSAAKTWDAGDLFSSFSTQAAHTITVTHKDAAGNPQSVTISIVKDTTAPTIAIAGPAITSGSLATNFVWTVTASEAATLSASAVGLISLGGTATSGCTKNITQTNSTTLSIAVTGCAGSGTVNIASLGAGLATDAAGNNSVAVVVASAAANVANTSLSVTSVSGPAIAEGTSVTSFVWTVTYSGNATVNTDATKVSLGGTATSGCSKNIAQGAGNTAIITVTGCTGNGTLNVASLSAGSATDPAGNSAGSYSTASATATVTNLTVVAAYSSNGSNWNDYVKYDGADIYSALDVACAGSEAGAVSMPGGCIHGGEMRKVSITGVSSCSGLSLTDALGVFTWRCVVKGGTATFFSADFQSGKGLKDLLNSASWKSNSVTLTGAGGGSSSSSPWWTNTVTALPDTSANVAPYYLNTSGTIYTISADATTYGYKFDSSSNKIGLVSLGTAKFFNNNLTPASNCNSTNGTTTSPNHRAVICGNNASFIWIEAAIDGVTNAVTGANQAPTAVTAAGMKFSRIHQSSITPMRTNTIYPAVSLSGSTSNLISNSDIFKASAGVSLLSNSNYNTIRNLRAVQITGTGYGISFLKVDTSSSNRFLNLQFSHLLNTFEAKGIYLYGANNNVFSQVKISNLLGSGNGDGFYVIGSSNNNIFTQLLVSAASDAGMNFDNASNSLISHATFVNNSWNGIYTMGLSFTNNFFNSVAIANTSRNIESTATTGTGNAFYNVASLDGDALDSCSSAAISLNGYYLYKTGYFPGTFGGSPTSFPRVSNSSFLGQVTSDTTNTSDASGIASYPGGLTTLLSLLNFDSFYRSWGLPGTFPLNTVRGQCTTGSCQIWDSRILTTDTVLRDRSANGNTANSSLFTFPGTTGGTCPAEINGNDTIAAWTGSKVFMKNAIEITDPQSSAYGLVGNHDGLCESNEACIYTPNIGAYQGEGSLATGSCVTSGAVNAATLYKFATTAN